MTVLYVVGIYLILLVTWVFFAAIMHFKKVLPTLRPVAKFNAYVALFLLGYPLDILANLIVSPLVFQRLPKAVLLTGTLKWWINSDDERRAATAAWICENKLDPFDPGHCK